jgi:hypothetical protein
MEQFLPFIDKFPLDRIGAGATNLRIKIVFHKLLPSEYIQILCFKYIERMIRLLVLIVINIQVISHV